jgi:hypothetical protein
MICKLSAASAAAQHLCWREHAINLLDMHGALEPGIENIAPFLEFPPGANSS